MLLVVVLVIISVLALLAASFAYRVNADLAAMRGMYDQQQARMASESGLQRAILLLRQGRLDQDNWYNNYQIFRRIPVYLPGDKLSGEGRGGVEGLEAQEKFEDGRPVWRYSIVAYERDDKQNGKAKIRYGLTDEAGKVNLNKASRGQLITLFSQVELEDNVTAEGLADALIDWIDDNDEVSPHGAESNYYFTKMKPRYRAKNKPLTSIDELLMIKGFNGNILYGEDYNRNGYLDDNENDGEEGAFPPDDGDGILDQGLLPSVTIWSWDWNRSNDNKMRLDLTSFSLSSLAGDGGGGGAGGGGAGGGGAGGGPGGGGAGGGASGGGAGGAGGGGGGAGGAGGGGAGAGGPGGGALAAAAQEKMLEPIKKEVRPEVLDFIAQVQRRRYRLRSVGDLLGLEVYENGTSNHDAMWRQFREDVLKMDKGSEAEEEGAEGAGRSGDEQGAGDEGINMGGGGQNGGENQNDKAGGEGDGGENGGGRNRGPGGDRGPGGGGDAGDQEDIADEQDNQDEQNGPDKNRRRQQSARDDSGNNEGGDEGPPQRGGGRNADRPNGGGNSGPGGPGRDRGGERPGGSRGGAGRGPGGRNDGEGASGGEGAGGREGRGGPGRGRGGREGGAGGPGAGGGRGRGRGTPIVSPVEAADMPALMDRFSVTNSPLVAGLINVNTAPPNVLRTIPGLDEQDVESIVSKRASLSGKDKLTPAWLVTTQAVSNEKFALISNFVTTRSIQFSIDAIGFADHSGAARRIQAVVEMRGQLAQIKYYRDITSLGIGFPVWDDQRSEGFAFSDQ